MSDPNYPPEYYQYYQAQPSSSKQSMQNPMPPTFSPANANPSEPRFLVPALPNEHLHPQSSSNIGDKQNDYFQAPNTQIRKPMVAPPQNLLLQDKTKLNIQRQQPWNKVSTNVVQQLHAPVASQDKHSTLITRAQNYKCVIPDATLQYLVRRHGGETTDPVTTRLLGIAAEKFVVDLLSDASTLARTRGLGQVNRATKETRYTLTRGLLREVAQERGIGVHLQTSQPINPMADFNKGVWIKDDSYSSENQQNHSDPYVVDEKGRKRMVNLKKMVRDVRLGRELRYPLQNVIVSKRINSILESGDIIIGQSIDSNYLGFIRQQRGRSFNVQFGLRSLLPEPQILNLPLLQAHRPIEKVAFSMSLKNRLAVFCAIHGLSMNVQIHLLLHELTIEIAHEDFEFNDGFKPTIITTENQVFYDLPFSFETWTPKFYFFKKYSEIPEFVGECPNYTVMYIHPMTMIAYCGRRSSVTIKKNNEKLQFRSIPHVSTDSDICIVQFQPDISSIVYYHLIRRHSKMVQARFMDCVGDIQRFDEHSSAFFVYMVLELNGGSIYVQCFVEIPTFSVSNNERKVEFLLIKKLNGGPWNVQRVHEQNRNFRVKTNLSKFSSSFAFADLTANQSVKSIKPRFGGFEYIC
uniref:Uncharacterized protein n=1 Tax=Panagrolaimus sp. JU765 TaxID=591449 RepID=A0AC34RJA3_9BILA